MLDKVGLRFAGNIQKTKMDQPENNYAANLLSRFKTPEDKVDISRSNKVVSFTGHNFEFKQNHNTIRYISFTGLQDPQKDQPIGLQMRITGVKNNQSNTIDEPSKSQPVPEEGKTPKPSKEEKKQYYRIQKEIHKLSRKNKNPEKLALLKQKAAKFENSYEMNTEKKSGKKPEKNKNGIRNLDKKGPGIKGSINKLADSNWKDGQKLLYTQAQMRTPVGTKDTIELSDPKYGKLGRVPDELAPALESLLFDSDYMHDLKFELSNVIAGMTKGAATIGLRANLIYTGTDPEKRAKVQETFDSILNNPKCTKKAMLYQEKTSPDEVLKKIFSHEEAKKAGSADKMEQVINNIINVFDDPENKNFLFVGHCKPDGDTLGAILAMKNAMELKYPDKNIDCAIDDKVPGLFRHNLPGIDGEVKRAINSDYEKTLQSNIEKFKQDPQNKITEAGINIQEAQIEILQDELQDIKEGKEKGRTLDLNKKYDVVVMFDVPTPERFSGAFKQYIEGAKKVIYIDHHPHRKGEWQDAQEKTGLDIDKVHQNGLAWIADAVPAATQLVGILATKLIPDLNKIATGEKKTADVFKTQEEQDHLKAMVGCIAAGASTDTGSYLRTANLLPEDMLKPAQQRPNFSPEGMTKWLMGLTDGIKGTIDKKWLRENISYDLDDNRIPDLDLTARETMLDYSIKGKVIAEDKELGKTGLGSVQVDYNRMFDVWYLARKSEKQQGKRPETTALDSQNGFKYGEPMNILRSNPTEHPAEKPNPKASKIEQAAMEDYESAYDDDRIAILTCQDKKEGFLDEKLNIATQNGLRLSLRSQEGTIYSELLANLFGGGGHGGASGGRVDLPGVTLTTPLGVEIDGKKATSPKQILEQLKKNHEIMNSDKSDEDKKAMCKKVKVVLDPTGKPCNDLIKDMVVEMRKEDQVEENKVVSFKGNSNIFKVSA